GLLRVTRDEQGELRLHDEQTWEQEQEGELKTRFLNGKLFNREHFEDIRQRLAAQS
ncbi:nicotinate phosphoribosyltransferase, partial [Citrobacter portucalensis]|nr:nicotinate phosphoribosyltransferase [Citrobacter portucalensis]